MADHNRSRVHGSRACCKIRALFEVRFGPGIRQEALLGYYKVAAAGQIKMVAVRQPNTLRGVTLAVYDSVAAYIRRSMGEASAVAGA
jgi:hypothetical protein